MKKKRLFILPIICFSFLFTGCNNKEERPYVIIGPMECEYKYLADELTERKIETQNNFTYYIGRLDGIKTIVVNSLVGTINSASAATLVIEKYHPKMIIMQGTAGAHNPSLNQGDIVIGQKNVLIYSYFTPPRSKGEGMDIINYEKQGTEMKDEKGNINKLDYIYSDAEGVNIAKNIKNEHGITTLGTVGTSDVWNREIDTINIIRNAYGTDCEEMEAYAVGHVSQNLKTKFMSIRCISNSEFIKEAIFDPIYGVYAQEFTRKFINDYERKTSSLF